MPATSIAAVAANIAIRVASSSGSMLLVSQEYPAHAHHTSPSTGRARRTPPPVGWCAISSETWVIAKTKTRSKNSSRVVTRSSPSRRMGIGRRVLVLIAPERYALAGRSRSPARRGPTSGRGTDRDLHVVAVVGAVQHLDLGSGRGHDDARRGPGR